MIQRLPMFVVVTVAVMGAAFGFLTLQSTAQSGGGTVNFEKMRKERGDSTQELLDIGRDGLDTLNKAHKRLKKLIESYKLSGSDDRALKARLEKSKGTADWLISQYKDKNISEVEKLTVRMGSYETLGFMQIVKMNTAPFVNPGLVKSIATGYLYDPAVFKTVTTRDFAEALVDIGAVALATSHKDGKYQIIHPHTKAYGKGWASIWMERSGSEQRLPGYVLMTADNNVLNATPKGEVVSWDVRW